MPATNWPHITPAEASRAMSDNGASYVDVRTAGEFELGHPQGAYNVPWLLESPGEPNPRFIEVMRANFPQDKTLIIGCQSGRRSTEAASALLEAGWQHVLEQFAGYGGRKDAFGKLIQPGWERAGLPTTTTPAPGHSYRELVETKAGGSGR